MYHIPTVFGGKCDSKYIGGFALRTRTRPVTIGRGMSTQMVSSTSTMSTTVPTARRDSNYAYYIHPEGDIRMSYVNGYDISYGYILIHIRVYFLASITIL